MYGAMRERAPNSTRMAGVTAALLMTAAAGYALANGFIGHVARLIETPLTFIPLANDPVPVDDRKPFDLPVSADAPPVPVPPIPDDVFTPNDDGGLVAPPGDVKVRTGAGTGGGTGRIAAPIQTRPVLLTRTPPPYPAADVRKQNTGTTGLNVCVNAGGRVTSANIASSSGHDSLDKAALKWIRDARFTPAKTDGVPQAVCGHEVIYDWVIPSD